MEAWPVRKSDGDPAGGWVGRPLAPGEIARIFSVMDHLAAAPPPRTLVRALLSWRLAGRPRMPVSPAAWGGVEPAAPRLGDVPLLAATRAAWRGLSPSLLARAVDACTILGGASLALDVVLDDPARLTDETVAACWAALPWCSPSWSGARGAALAGLFRRTRATHLAMIGRTLGPLLHRGHLPVVEALLASRVAAALPPVVVTSARAWLALWADRAGDALLWTDDDAVREAPGVATLRAIADVRSRCSRDAVRSLDEVERSAGAPLPRWERELLGRWKAEGLLRLGLVDEGKAALIAGSDHPARPLLTRVREVLSGERTRSIDEGRYLYTLKRMRELDVPRPADDALIDRLGAPALDALWRAVDAFGGNRGDACTVVDGGRLRVAPLLAPRHHAEALQRAILSLPPADVLALLERAAAAHHEVPYFDTYACEIQLWTGDYAAARARLAALAEATRTRWSFIGLGAAAFLDGDAAAAERAWSGGSDVYTPLPAEATRAWRGEIALRAGALDQAAQHLDHAVRARCTRLRAWLLTVLVADRRGQRDAAWEAFRRAVGLAPGAAFQELADARAAALRDHLVRDEAAPGDPVWAEALTVVARWIERMRGNASSVLHTRDDPAEGLVATEPIEADSFFRAMAIAEAVE